MNKKVFFILASIGIILLLFILTLFLLNNRQIIRSRAAGSPNCPSGTQLLFSSGTSLKVGNSVTLSGKVESVDGQAFIENKDGVPMATYVKSMNVKFPNQIILDSALIFDNDPKSGEKPWSINGVSLPVTGGGNWAPPFKLNLTTNVMNFDNGGDSSHFNVCVKSTITATSTPQPSNTPGSTRTPTPTKTRTPTPTKTRTPTPTPTAELTPTETPVPTITPTISICPVPNAVTDVKVTCQTCIQP